MNCEHCGQPAMRGWIICDRCADVCMHVPTPVLFPCSVPPRWYCMANNGLATLCANENDARIMAQDGDISWPKNAPHRAVLLGDVSAVPDMLAALQKAVVLLSGVCAHAPELKPHDAYEAVSSAIAKATGCSA